MLQRTKGPSLRKRRGNSSVKCVHLCGSDPAITNVAERRAGNAYCRQRPRSMADLGKKSRVRVTYEVADDGFVVVHRVYVLIGKEWVCFFDRNTGRDNVFTGRGKEYSAPEFVYLTTQKLMGIIEAVGRIEDSIAVNRLTRLGPEVFQKKKSG